ncbi:MAG: c-type cytochrome [Candidatus Sumerlaeia bacterium]
MKRTISAVALLLGVIILIGCISYSSEMDIKADVTMQLPPQQYRPLKLSPVTTFEDACARCHGPQGSFYGEEFAKLEKEELRPTVKEMMEGPAFLKPTKAEVDAMTAYHRALEKKEPFICVTTKAEQEDGGLLLQGECNPGAEIFAMAADSEQKQDIDLSKKGKWEYLLRAENALIRAERKKAASVLSVPEQQWTHRQVGDEKTEAHSE